MVFDSSALLVFLQGESGNERVARALETQACITTLTLMVILRSLVGAQPRVVLADLERLGVEIVSLDETLALEAARLKANPEDLELVCALALAKIHGLELISKNVRTDLALEAGVKVNAVR